MFINKINIDSFNLFLGNFHSLSQTHASFNALGMPINWNAEGVCVIYSNFQFSRQFITTRLIREDEDHGIHVCSRIRRNHHVARNNYGCRRSWVRLHNISASGGFGAGFGCGHSVPVEEMEQV